MVPGQSADDLRQLLLVLGNWRHRSLHKGSLVLGQPEQPLGQLLLFDGPCYVAVDQSEYIHIFIQN